MTAVPIPAKMGEPVMMMSTPTAVSVLQVTQGKTVKQILMIVQTPILAKMEEPV